MKKLGDIWDRCFIALSFVAYVVFAAAFTYFCVFVLQIQSAGI